MRSLSTVATLLLGLASTAALVVTVIGPLHAGHKGGGEGHGGGGGEGGITLGDLSCSTDEIAMFVGSNWICSDALSELVLLVASLQADVAVLQASDTAQSAAIAANAALIAALPPGFEIPVVTLVTDQNLPLSVGTTDPVWTTVLPNDVDFVWFSPSGGIAPFSNVGEFPPPASAFPVMESMLTIYVGLSAQDHADANSSGYRSAYVDGNGTGDYERFFLPDGWMWVCGNCL